MKRQHLLYIERHSRELRERAHTGLAEVPYSLDLLRYYAIQNDEAAQDAQDDVELADVKDRHIGGSNW